MKLSISCEKEAIRSFDDFKIEMEGMSIGTFDESFDDDEEEDLGIPITDPKEILTAIYGRSEEEADEILKKSTPSEDDAEDIEDIFKDMLSDLLND